MSTHTVYDSNVECPSFRLHYCLNMKNESIYLSFASYKHRHECQTFPATCFSLTGNLCLNCFCLVWFGGRQSAPKGALPVTPSVSIAQRELHLSIWDLIHVFIFKRRKQLVTVHPSTLKVHLHEIFCSVFLH